MPKPLRIQIMVPMIGIMLLTVAVVSVLNSWLASARVKRQLEQQIADVSRTLTTSNFPLESNVLRQMRGLTSADFVVIDTHGRAVAASDESLNSLAEAGSRSRTAVDLSAVAAADGRRFFHAIIPVDRQATGRGNVLLHVFYSERALLEARWQAVWPPLAIGGASILLTAVVVSLIVRRVTQPIQHLGEQVERIAQGDFRAMPIPKRQDEVQALAVAVNQMAQRLVQYEEQIRSGERTRAIGTLGGGIAHQIRNAATGCRIALDLHQRDYRSLAGNGHAIEPLAVAVKQLAQIELSVQRLLALGKPSVVPKATTDLVAVTRESIELVRPMISHRDVELTVAMPQQSLFLLADSHSLIQLVVNLLVNAVEAAAHTLLDPDGQQRGGPPVIDVRLNATSADRCELAIGNSGPGPAQAIQPRLFEPFATDKPGGTGLGLAVARRIAEDHGGSLRWEQRDPMTWFFVTLPARA